MKSIEVEQLDGGRVLVNRVFRAVLEAHDLTTFEAFMAPDLGASVKATLRHRMTARFELGEGDASRGFYIKRHEAAPLREYLKPLSHLRWPLIGAGHEWRALVRFHALGIATMVPVACGQSGRRSFVVTEALEGFTKLSDWVAAAPAADGSARGETARLARAVAAIARTMHDDRLHHQDFYLNHLLRRDADGEVFVIDLGRVRRFGWPALRWIVKDLAQLAFSADDVRRTDRMRFLRAYLGRRLTRGDRLLVRLIERKAASIRRHATRER